MQLVYSLLLLFSVVVIAVQGQEVAMSIKTLFTGVDNSDPNASVFDVMLEPKNHATATATILQYFAAQKDFHPKQQGLYRSADKLVEYEFIIGFFRPFVFKSKQNPVLKLEGGPIQLKEAIAAAYSPISGKADVVAAAFVDQIPSSADQSLSGIWDLAVITIHAEEDNKITLDMSTLEIGILVDNDGSVLIPPQDAGLFQVTHELDPEHLLEDIADFFDDLSKVDAETFADNFSTPNPEGSNPSLAALLFGSDHSCEDKPMPFKYTHRRQRLYRLSRLSGDY
ncbi:hypothetical protein BGX34_007558 [Mortierella sp. NVP85]|nr:hypothetical protein BGX34_007558 [Mortierella sp. NVP85]